MRATWYIVRGEARRHRAALLGLVLLAGLAGGVVLASASGARRTATAYDRLLDESNAGHVLFSSEADDADYGQMRGVDGVEAVAPIVGLELFPAIEADVVDILNLASADGTFGYEVERPNVLEGRLPSPDRPDEMLVSRSFVDEFDLELGDRVEMVAELAEEDVAAAGGPVSFPVTIVGIGVSSADVVPTTDLDALPATLMPPALLEAVVAEADVVGFDGAAVVLSRPEDAERIIADAMEVMGDETLFVVEQTTTQATVERAIRPQATAMWAFASVVGVAAILVVSQAVARNAATVIAQNRALGALGVRRRELIVHATILHALVGAVAAMVAAAVATAASPLFPIGRARAAEVHPGVAVNGAIVAAGAASIVLLVAASAAVAAWVSTRAGERAAARRPSVVAAAMASAGASPRMVLGVRRAFEAGSGSAAVPIRSGLVGASLAVAAVVATATFATSLDELVNEPTRYGQAWSVAFDAQFGPAPAGEMLERFGDDPRVTGVGGIVYSEVGVGGEAVPVIGFERLAGDLELTILDGRAPSAPQEIALGRRTMDDIGVGVGEEVAVETEAGQARWTVVGTAVFPQLSLGSFSALGLGTGGLVDASALPPPYSPDDLIAGVEQGDLPPGWAPDDFLVDERSFNAVLLAAPRAADAIATELEGHELAEMAGVRLDQRPAAISTYAEVRATPVVLTALLAALGAGLVTHVLLTAVRRRRNELAVCRVVGMRRRDVLSIVRWQATAVAVTAALVGVPLGLAGGRVAWRLFAEDLGVPGDAALAWGWIAIAVVATLLISNAAAAIPGWQAGHVRPATALRAE